MNFWSKRQWSKSRRADAVQAQYRDLENAIIEASEQLSDAKKQRRNASPILYYVGLLAFLILPPLALVEAANNAPILEALLGLPGMEEDKWMTPIGALHPLAVGASLVIVLAMGIAALIAWTGNHSLATEENEQNSVEQNAAPDSARPTRRKISLGQSLRGLMAVTVMLALVGVIGYGGFLRGKLGIEEGGALAEFASQQAMQSGIFSAAIALVEEAAVVVFVFGFLIPQLSVSVPAMKRKWLMGQFRKVQGDGIVHTSVTAARELMAQAKKQQEELRRQLDSLEAALGSYVAKEK